MEHKPIAIMILPVFVMGILMLGILAATGNAQESSNAGTTSGAASGADQQTILTIHNRERAAVGTPDLVWSNSLAADARTWLDKLVAESGGDVERGGLRHDPVNTGISCTLGTACQGENLAFASKAATGGPPVAPSVEQLVGQWVNEPKGRLAANHYTQMVWKDTKEVGCATAEKRGMTSDGWHAVGVYLNCRYSPPGNTEGVPAY
jgi:uncharacterized protein YkwD